MFERFTDRSRRVLVLAQEAARSQGDDHIQTAHFLVGLILENEGVGGRVLTEFGLTVDVVTRALSPGSEDAQPALDADSLRTLGIDLDEVLRAANEAFGPDRVDAAVRRSTRRRTPSA